MEAKELRIGNYVSYFDKIIEINSIRKDNTYYLGGTKNITTFYNTIDAFKPIPLTEDWLLKFGFEKMNKQTRHGNGQDWTPEYPKTIQQDYRLNDFIVRFEQWHWISKQKINIDYTDYVIIGDWHPEICDTQIFAEIKHVHQLQNLYFALCGEELTIKELAQ